MMFAHLVWPVDGLRSLSCQPHRPHHDAAATKRVRLFDGACWRAHACRCRRANHDLCFRQLCSQRRPTVSRSVWPVCGSLLAALCDAAARTRILSLFGRAVDLPAVAGRVMSKRWAWDGRSLSNCHRFSATRHVENPDRLATSLGGLSGLVVDEVAGGDMLSGVRRQDRRTGTLALCRGSPPQLPRYRSSLLGTRVEAAASWDPGGVRRLAGEHDGSDLLHLRHH